MTDDDQPRWRITDIEVPFKCVVWWMLKMLASYLLIILGIAVLAATLLGILSLAGANFLHQGDHPPKTHFADPNFWK